ncbi:winged helix-turn-helix transcriptional regulator [Streptosporangium sp. DT93]|uniref:winged helix-turn-helix transcriptional regulator n=1 Tax=Streptosporangium sp. DT93 TaxID=3393428 RepID=UPI003CEF70CF
MEEGTSKSPSRCADTGDAYVDARQWDTREDCEVRQILDRVADKWSLLVIALLDRRSLRFTELSREIDGVSQRMLTVTLRHLERDGLVRRTVHPVVPPRVDYELTPLGMTLHDTIQSLVTWTERHQNEIAAARAGYDTHRETAPAGPDPRVVAQPGDATKPGDATESGGATEVNGKTKPGEATKPGSAAGLGGATKHRVVVANRNETPAVSSPREESTAPREEGVDGGDPPGCEMCGAPLREARTGRPARFCGTACRQKAHRHRSRAASRPTG